MLISCWLHLSSNTQALRGLVQGLHGLPTKDRLVSPRRLPGRHSGLRVFERSLRSGCSLEGLMLKLKLQYFGHLKRRVDSLEKTLMLGGIGAGEEGDDRG